MTDKLCLIGLGYVGLPLAVAFAEKYSVIGFDINQSRIEELDAGTDRTLEVDDESLATVRQNITYTSDIGKARDCNIYIVTVPTPIDEYKRPDLTSLIKSSEMIGEILNSGDIVIFESTVYPGATEEICVPILEQKSSLAYMNKNEMNNYYKNMINEESTLSRQVGWRDELAQTRRFQQLYKLIEDQKNIEIADLGCGLAGFYTFLKEQKSDFTYTGYDLSGEMIKNAKEVIEDDHNTTELLLIEKTQDIKDHDFMILSGIFNMKRNIQNNEWLKYILEQLEIINQKSKKGFAFNLLTSYSDEEFKKDELYYAEPSFFFDYCKRHFATNIALLHDYDEYDFTIIVRQDPEYIISE